MMGRGHNRDSLQCRVKVKEIKQAYQKAKKANRHSRAEPQTCCFTEGGDTTTTAPLTVDSNEGVLSHAEDFADGEEEEEEEEDNDELAESTQHTVLPNSKDLFLSLTDIASRGIILDHEAGEGTSVANFSSLHPEGYLR